MSIIDEDIKNGKLNHIYLIYGEESFLRKQYKERLKKALSPDEDSMNYSYYEGKDISTGEIIDLAETMPFLAERRTIIIENSPFFKSEGEKIAEYLSAVPDTTYFVFVEESVDKRSKMYKAIAKNGCVVEAQGLSEDKLVTWILQLLKKDNKKITQNSMHYLLDKIGTNMENIRQEVEKLVCSLPAGIFPWWENGSIVPWKIPVKLPSGPIGLPLPIRLPENGWNFPRNLQKSIPGRKFECSS